MRPRADQRRNGVRIDARTAGLAAIGDDRLAQRNIGAGDRVGRAVRHEAEGRPFQIEPVLARALKTLQRRGDLGVGVPPCDHSGAKSARRVKSGDGFMLAPALGGDGMGLVDVRPWASRTAFTAALSGGSGCAGSSAAAGGGRVGGAAATGADPVSGAASVLRRNQRQLPDLRQRREIRGAPARRRRRKLEGARAPRRYPRAREPAPIVSTRVRSDKASPTGRRIV